MAGARWQTFTTAVTGPGLSEPCTCEQAGCDKFRNGWKVALDESIPEAARRARYLRTVTQRQFDETSDPSGVTVFTFQPGVPCFCDVRDHRGRAVFETSVHIRQVRQGLHVVRPGHLSQIRRPVVGDSSARVHSSSQDWAEHAFESYDRMLSGYFR